jgi:hypothetical protein
MNQDDNDRIQIFKKISSQLCSISLGYRFHHLALLDYVQFHQLTHFSIQMSSDPLWEQFSMENLVKSAGLPKLRTLSIRGFPPTFAESLHFLSLATGSLEFLELVPANEGLLPVREVSELSRANSHSLLVIKFPRLGLQIVEDILGSPLFHIKDWKSAETKLQQAFGVGFSTLRSSEDLSSCWCQAYVHEFSSLELRQELFDLCWPREKWSRSSSVGDFIPILSRRIDSPANLRQHMLQTFNQTIEEATRISIFQAWDLYFDEQNRPSIEDASILEAYILRCPERRIDHLRHESMAALLRLSPNLAIPMQLFLTSTHVLPLFVQNAPLDLILKASKCLQKAQLARLTSYGTWTPLLHYVLRFKQNYVVPEFKELLELLVEAHIDDVTSLPKLTIHFDSSFVWIARAAKLCQWILPTLSRIALHSIELWKVFVRQVGQEDIFDANRRARSFVQQLKKCKVEIASADFMMPIWELALKEETVLGSLKRSSAEILGLSSEIPQQLQDYLDEKIVLISALHKTRAREAIREAIADYFAQKVDNS